jgi:hypothetical protein
MVDVFVFWVEVVQHYVGVAAVACSEDDYFKVFA